MTKICEKVGNKCPPWETYVTWGKKGHRGKCLKAGGKDNRGGKYKGIRVFTEREGYKSDSGEPDECGQRMICKSK